MQPVLNVEDIKKVEHHLADVGVSISELMHRAGLAAVVVAPPREELEELLFKSDVVIDAMFGTGFRGFAHEPFYIWIDFVKKNAAHVVGFDFPNRH